MQAAAVLGLVPLAGTVQTAPVVRHQHVARTPAVLVDELAADHVGEQFRIQLF